MTHFFLKNYKNIIYNENIIQLINSIETKDVVELVVQSHQNNYHLAGTF